MGNRPFEPKTINRFCAGLHAQPALKKAASDEYQITEFGHRLLASKAEWISSSGGVDIGLGGVHLAGTEADWRWDADRQTLSYWALGIYR